MENKQVKQNLSLQLKDGRQIGFAECGDPNGSPVFYFHGFPGSRLEACRFHDIAITHQFRLISIDRPGIGLSTIDKNRSILSFATDVANFADCLGIEKFSLIGYSSGAPFVAACAYAIPDRINSVAIVSGMGPFEKPESQMGLAREQKIANRLIKTIPPLLTLMVWLLYKILKKPNKLLVQLIKQLPEVDQAIMLDPRNQMGIINNTSETFRNGVYGPTQEIKLLLKPWGFDLEQISCPVTIWYGTLDRQVPISHARIYANLIPNAQLKIVENEGHHSLIKKHMQEIMSSLRI